MTRPNYVDRKRNLDILLTFKEYKYVLTEKCSNLSTTNVPRLKKERYKKWVKTDEMTRCYILLSISSILQHQPKDYLSTTDMILSLKEVFGEQRRPARQIAMRVLMNTKMSEETPMRDHVLKMFDHLNTLEILGGEIDVESQIDIILESLPDSFN